MSNSPSPWRLVTLYMLARPGPGPRWDEQVPVPGLLGRPLGPDLAEPEAARRQSLQPQVQQLTGVGGFPPSHYGRHGHPLGSLQVLALGYSEAGAPNRAGHL